jgi:hypothetical protein
MSDAKRHHYVPQFILNNFVESDNKLYVWYKDQNEIICSAPRDVFVENHGYNNTLEDGYSITEAEAAPIVKKIIDGSPAQHVLSLSNVERKDLDMFVFCLWFRGPDYIESLPSVRDRGGIKGNSSLRDESVEAQINLVCNEEGAVACEILANLECGACAVNGKDRLVLGSSPVVHYESSIWLPITPTLAVRYVAPRVTLPYELGDDAVGAINRAVVDGLSSKIASGSKERLEALRNAEQGVK